MSTIIEIYSEDFVVDRIGSQSVLLSMQRPLNFKTVLKRFRAFESIPIAHERSSNGHDYSLAWLKEPSGYHNGHETVTDFK